MARTFKVGDKVRIKSIEWFNEQDKDEYGNIGTGEFPFFHKDMTKYCSKIGTITFLTDVNEYWFLLSIDSERWQWSGWMVEKI